MAYYANVAKFVGGNTFSFTQGSGAGNQVPLTLETAGISFWAFPHRPFLMCRMYLTTATLTGTARAITVFGTSLGSISAWPADLTPNRYIKYDLPNQPPNAIPTNLFVFGAGGTSANLVGGYEIWACSASNG